ncbi:TetR/AcrR family transcriptional regulator [Sphingomonas colocasiae]|uniref:TetR/AcrR family transcriptional regulator n=1 Tax=Sphingomonas colocasiae TaxID=1848973 RepID=A0ABS7Q068_9SPHN|nr:TetR/AcrR family transcriptional regulator [Sphingomonas colocasiae]MBY8825644.1 TetR/AcrR family transcriptional regulator [Sphingomonas colocasiae]
MRARSRTLPGNDAAHVPAAIENAPRQSAKARKRWADILRVTTELFNRRGFFATSMQDISDAVGIRKASLYYYVDSKEELLFEILKDLHLGGIALAESVNFSTTDPLGELRAFLVQLCIYTGKHADRLAIYSRDFDYLDQSQQNAILAERRIYYDTLVRLIELAVRQGQVPASFDIPTIGQVVMRGVVSISQWYSPGGPLPIEQIAVQSAGIMVQGLACYDRSAG